MGDHRLDVSEPAQVRSGLVQDAPLLPVIVSTVRSPFGLTTPRKAPDVPRQRDRRPRRAPGQRLRIALLGTRGVPAAYGGFETAVEEVGSRLVLAGHDVTVYCRLGAEDRNPEHRQPEHRQPEHRQPEHRGMHLVHLPALRRKTLETLSHTGLSTLHMTVRRERFDAAVVFNCANAPFLPLLRAQGVPVATHVDGLEWKRAKWGGTGRHYYRRAEAMAVRWSDAIIADADGIAEYYQQEFGVGAQLISYGAPILRSAGSDLVAGLGLRPGGYHLLVARFEPENHVDLALEGYLRSPAALPLVVVGSAPYADAYTARIRQLAATDDRVRLLGAVWDQALLDQLYANALTYVHGHSVGGTNPSLLRAIGAATACSAYDVSFNHEVLGADGRYFASAAAVAGLFGDAEADPSLVVARGARLQQRASERYDWDEVAGRYEQLCRGLADGTLSRLPGTGRRRRLALVS